MLGQAFGHFAGCLLARALIGCPSGVYGRHVFRQSPVPKVKYVGPDVGRVRRSEFGLAMEDGLEGDGRDGDDPRVEQSVRSDVGSLAGQFADWVNVEEPVASGPEALTRVDSEVARGAEGVGVEPGRHQITKGFGNVPEGGPMSWLVGGSNWT